MAEDHGGGHGGHEEEGKKKEKKHKGGHGGGHGGGGHHEEGVPEWMVSFADNVCLMMGFFVIMLAMNMGPKGGGEGVGTEGGSPPGEMTDSYLDLAIGIREGFNNPVKMNSADPNDQALIRRMKQKQGETNDRNPKGENEKVQGLRTSDFYSYGGTVLFADGSAELSAVTASSVNDIADFVKGTKFMVEVRGHVSAMEAQEDVGVAMDLSHRRALVVAKALAAKGVEWGRLRVVACGDAERITALAYDSKGHRTNQRVEALVTKEVMAEDPHLREPTAGVGHEGGEH